MRRIVGLFLVAAAPVASAAGLDCPKSTPESIAASYRLTWGPVSPQRGISSKGSCAVMDGFIHHSVACGLPAPAPELSGAFLKCPSRKAVFALLRFLARQSRNPDSCREYFRAVWRDNGLFSEESFCGAAYAAAMGGGLGDLCPQLGRFLPPGVEGSLSGCRRQFPYKEEDCGKKKACLESFALHRALKAKKPEACPEGYKDLCARPPREEGSPAKRCEAAREALKAVYCAQYREAFARTSGQVGMTDAELKAIDAANRQIQGRERR